MTAVQGSSVRCMQTAEFTQPTTSFKSIQFMKQLIGMTVSNICYLRGFFPENAFVERYLGNQKIKVFSQRAGHPGANTVISWLKGACDALKKRYLRQLILCVQSYPDSNEVLEAYSLSFSYKEPEISLCARQDVKGDVTETAISLDDIDRAARLLLASTYRLAESTTPNPKGENGYLSVKLIYDEHNTPENYEAPGFHRDFSQRIKFTYPILAVKHGKVESPWNVLELRSKIRREEISSDKDEERNFRSFLNEEHVDLSNNTSKDITSDYIVKLSQNSDSYVNEFDNSEFFNLQQAKFSSVTGSQPLFSANDHLFSSEALPVKVDHSDTQNVEEIKTSGKRCSPASTLTHGSPQHRYPKRKRSQ